MSSRASFVSVPSGQAGDAVANNYTMSVTGSRYEASPNAVADGEIRGFQIDSTGKMVVTGAQADNNAFIARPIGVGGIYNLALPTYDDGDATTLQSDSRGRLIVNDDQLLTAFNAEDFATETTLAALSAAFSGTDFATETTLAAAAVSLASIAAEDFATQTTLDALLTAFNAEDFATQTTLDALLTAFNAEDFATETTLAVIAGAIKNEDAVASSGEAGIPALAVRQDTLASANADGDYGHLKTDSLGRVYVNFKDSLLSVVDFIDTSPGPVIDTSSDNIPASASSPLTIVASLAGAVKKIRVADTTGEFIGLYSDPAGTPVLEAIINPGMDGEMEIRLAAGTALGLRNMANAAISVGQVSIQFLG